METILKMSEAVSIALHASALLASDPGTKLSNKQIAGRLHVSEAHLSKVLQRLVKVGLVRSMKGPKGGFVLADSGHIAGVINSPATDKYGFKCYEGDAKAFSTADKWFQHSVYQKGSWWHHWLNWQKSYAGPLLAKRIPGKGKLKIIQDAPGEYVRKRI